MTGLDRTGHTRRRRRKEHIGSGRRRRRGFGLEIDLVVQRGFAEALYWFGDGTARRERDDVAARGGGKRPPRSRRGTWPKATEWRARSAGRRHQRAIGLHRPG